MSLAELNEELIFAVDEIPKDGISGKRRLEASWFSLPPEVDDPIQPLHLLEPISIDFHLERIGRDVRLELSLETVASLTCARCLKAFPSPVQTQSRFTLLEATPGSPVEKELELTPEHLESGTFEAGKIDLSSMIYEQIVLSFPIKPLCHENCRGLCPNCGADQNLERCECVKTPSDPRWEALKKLKNIPAGTK